MQSGKVVSPNAFVKRAIGAEPARIVVTKDPRVLLNAIRKVARAQGRKGKITPADLEFVKSMPELHVSVGGRNHEQVVFHQGHKQSLAHGLAHARYSVYRLRRGKPIVPICLEIIGATTELDYVRATNRKKYSGCLKVEFDVNTRDAADIGDAMAILIHKQFGAPQRKLLVRELMDANLTSYSEAMNWLAKKVLEKH